MEAKFDDLSEKRAAVLLAGAELAMGEEIAVETKIDPGRAVRCIEVRVVVQDPEGKSSEELELSAANVLNQLRVAPVTLDGQTIARERPGVDLERPHPHRGRIPIEPPIFGSVIATLFTNDGPLPIRIRVLAIYTA